MQPIASGTAAAASVGGQGWPVSLRRYVERAFAQKIPDEKKGALNVALKQIISDAQASTYVLWTHAKLSFINNQRPCHLLQRALSHLRVSGWKASVECAGKGGAVDQELGDDAAAPVAGGRGYACSKACSRARLMAGSAQGCQVLQPQRQAHPGDFEKEQVALIAQCRLCADVPAEYPL